MALQRFELYKVRVFLDKGPDQVKVLEIDVPTLSAVPEEGGMMSLPGKDGAPSKEHLVVRVHRHRSPEGHIVDVQLRP